MKKRNLGPDTDKILHTPAYPFAGTQLFQRLRFMLVEAFGADLPLRQLGRLTGQSPSTTQHWFGSFGHPHLIFFLCLLEQLPETKRMELINEFCRDLPLPKHMRLAHDPLAVSMLENLARQKTGLSIIHGPNFQRTWVATALGNASVRSKGGEALVAGMDVHEPTQFVPVPGMLYFRGLPTAAEVQQSIMEAWPAILDSQSKLLLLNGVWSLAPGLRRQILEQTRKRHVIIAEANMPELSAMRGIANGRISEVSVGHATENPFWIRVQVSAV